MAAAAAGLVLQLASRRIVAAEFRVLWEHQIRTRDILRLHPAASNLVEA